MLLDSSLASRIPGQPYSTPSSCQAQALPLEAGQVAACGNALL